jgi:NADH dehydrogenase/NADH:ubiquinone oxidoreductase subunit G
MAPETPNRVHIRIDEETLEVEEGAPLLEICLKNGIYIPNFCYLEGFEPQPASCRLCFVAIEGRPRPTPACTEPVVEDMVVHTDTPEVRRLQKSALAMLLSVHHVDCKNCHANKRCGLQQVARFLKVGLKPRGLERYLKEPEVDTRHPCLDYFPNRCVLCGRCIRVCRAQQKKATLTFARRGFNTLIDFFGDPEAAAENCSDCKACVGVCPVGALQFTADTSVETATG